MVANAHLDFVFAYKVGCLFVCNKGSLEFESQDSRQDCDGDGSSTDRNYPGGPDATECHSILHLSTPDPLFWGMLESKLNHYM
jgi:hypothetical protein